MINSFNKEGLIDELYIYTAHDKLIESDFKMPIDMKDWKLKTSKMLGSDELQVFEKGEACLQE